MPSTQPPLTDKLHRNSKEHKSNETVVYRTGAGGVFRTLERNKKRLAAERCQGALQNTVE